MLSVLPFLFCGPVGYGVAAYAATRLKIDDVESGRTLKNQLSADTLSRRPVYSGLGDEECVNIKDLLKKHGIRRDVKIIQECNPEFSVSCGTNRFTRATAVIYVPPKLFQTDLEALRFLVIREIAHIKNNDLFYGCLIPAICSLVIAIFTVRIWSVRTAMCITYLIAWSFYWWFNRLSEDRATSFAIQNSSKSELLGARRFYVSMQHVKNQSQRSKYVHFPWNERLTIEQTLLQRALLQEDSSLVKEVLNDKRFPELENILQNNVDGLQKTLSGDRRLFYAWLFFKLSIPHESARMMHHAITRILWKR